MPTKNEIAAERPRGNDIEQDQSTTTGAHIVGVITPFDPVALLVLGAGQASEAARIADTEAGTVGREEVADRRDV
jgi:hypothetical protein